MFRSCSADPVSRDFGGITFFAVRSLDAKDLADRFRRTVSPTQVGFEWKESLASRDVTASGTPSNEGCHRRRWPGRPSSQKPKVFLWSRRPGCER